jgi:hypothetical protein
MSRAYTQKEVQKQFLDAIHSCVDYWEEVTLPKENDTTHHRLDGLAFSILNILDGTSASFPATEIALSPHPDDKQYHIDNQENWYEPGMTIHGNEYLHDKWHK